MIVITTPTGNIGRHLAQQLLSSNEEITLLVRDAQKLPEIVRQQATVLEGSLDDVAQSNTYECFMPLLRRTPMQQNRVHLRRQRQRPSRSGLQL